MDWFDKMYYSVYVGVIIVCSFAQVGSHKLVADRAAKLRILQDKDDGRSSLVFVFDTTGSMYNDLRQLREGAEMIMDTALEESKIIADFVFVPFHDPGVGPATVTSDKQEFKAALNAVRVYGGGDCPEKSLSGIRTALDVSRPRSFVYVFTDATAGDHRRVGEVLDAVQRKQSQVVFVLTGHCNDLQKPSYQVYRQIAAASSGQVFNLNKTSVHKVLDFVRTSIKGRNVNLGSSVNPAGYNHTQGIPVDSTLGEVTVSVSGVKPQIKVFDPKGEELTGPPKLVTTLDLSEIMVVKVMQPEPGNWSITVGSAKDYSVKVVGLSNLTFQHGFSVSPPGTMRETSYRPLKSTYNHLMISLTDAEAPATINYAEILDLSGKTLYEVPLKEADKEKKIYLADPFIPPDDFFYVAINGHDGDGQELRRIGATAVQAKLPDAPYLTTPQKVEARYHERVTLTCDVESLVPVTAQWTKDSTRIQPKISSLQSTSIEYVIEDMGEEHVGTYSCFARNVAGLKTATTELELTVDPPQVSISPGNVTLQMGEELAISCRVYSEAVLQRMQLVISRMDKDVKEIYITPNPEGLYIYNESIPHVDERHTGTYHCVAANRAGLSNQSMVITVLTQPIVQILGPHSIKRPIHSDVQLCCHVENADRMQWVSPNGTVVVEQALNGSYDGMFEVKNVTGGSWTCVGLRGSYKTVDVIEVDVLIKPQARVEGSKNITVMNGTTHDITCYVTAKPAPRIVWHRETENFLNHVMTPLGNDLYKSVLKLNSSEEGAEATYFCIGENSEGIAEDGVAVTVRRKMTLVEGFNDKSVEIYSQVDLHCEVDAHPPARMTWHHNGTALATDANVQVSDDSSVMYVLMVDFANLGQYSCEADNGYEKLVVNGTLSVRGLESPVLEKEPAKQTVRRGESSILTCRVLQGKPEPILSWQYRRNASAEFSDLPWGIELPDDGTNLTMSEVTVDHDGVYRCVAENVIGRDEYDVQLVVQYPPELIEPSNATTSLDEPIEVEAGHKVILSCKAVGAPPPAVVWTKNRKPLAYTNNVYLNDGYDLVIENVTAFDSGLFTCTATSVLGSSEKNFTLFVYVRPSISPLEEPPGADFVEGQLVQLPCAASGVPMPRVQWLRDGNKLTDTRKYIDEFGMRFVANVTDFGNYTCLVENDFGNVSVSYPLYVWVPPSVVPVDTSKDVLAGTNVTLQCNALGFPIPEITWEFRDEELIENTTYISFDNIGNLYIRNVSAAHDGTYACVAHNDAGFDKKYIRLRVNEPPIIVEHLLRSYIATNMDTELVLSCSASGRPKPYILWAKDDKFLIHDSTYSMDFEGTLTIKSPSEELSGSYVCVAKNAVGEANETISVDIYTVPVQMQSEDSQTKVAVVEGTNTSVECPVPASPKDLVKWYKNAKLVSEGRLSIANVSRHNSSDYACVVTNVAGSATSSVALDVQWPPAFVASGDSTVEVIRGDDGYLDCTVDAKPTAKTKWLFNGSPMAFQDQERLKLLNIQPRHAGGYQCLVSNGHGAVNRTYTLAVLVPPTILSSESYEEYVTLGDGMNVTLECDATGTPQPNLQWTYKVYRTTPVGVRELSEWRKQVGSNLTVTTEGVYRCEASNRAGDAQLVYFVSRVAAPEVTGVLLYRGGEATTLEKRTDVKLGENIRISCEVSGEPTPKVQWIRNGNALSENRDDISYADLNLASVQASTAGVYSCVAANEAGSTERKIRLDVLEPPKIFHPLSFNATNNTVYLEVLSGQSFSLHCHAAGHPPAELYWFREGERLRILDAKVQVQEYGEVLAVSEASSDHTGNYTCVARNSQGEDSLVYLVDVLVPPSIPKESAKAVKTRLGKPLTLVCPVDGSPLPSVAWIRHPYVEISDNTPRVTLLNDSFTMVINKTELSDNGRYSCVMTNRVGTTEVAFDVTVEMAPSIAGDVRDGAVETHLVPLMRSVVLKCEAKGHPPPRISWLKDTQRLSESLSNIQQVLGHSLLAIWSAGVRDAGQYVCVAENAAGAAHRRHNVAVRVPGKWSEWSAWSLCDATCGLGHQARTRLCRYIDLDNVIYDKTNGSGRIILDESECKGPTVDKRKCHMPACEEQRSRWAAGAWGAWGAWSACAATCGAATQARLRRCRSAPCPGDNVQIRRCPNLPPCDGVSQKREIEDLNSTEYQPSREITDTVSEDPYLPEATYEMQPESMTGDHRSHGSPDVEEFYSNAELKPPNVYEVNVTSNLDFSDNGPCAFGYRYNTTEKTCDDIDECLYEYNQCHATQVCANTAGAYRCSCGRGYSSLGAGQRCLDINECELEADACEFACVNVAGGYVCACPRRLRLHADRRRCVAPSSYQQPSELDRLETGDYLSAKFEVPPRFAKYSRN